MAHATTAQTDTATKTVDRYFEAWNARDPEVRLTAIQGACAPDIAYTDPKADVKGHQAMNDMMGAVQGQILAQHATFSFVRTSTIDEHHRRIRFNWALKGPDGNTALSGVDFAEIADDGRLRVIVGFFGEGPAGSTSQP